MSKCVLSFSSTHELWKEKKNLIPGTIGPRALYFTFWFIWKYYHMWFELKQYMQKKKKTNQHQNLRSSCKLQTAIHRFSRKNWYKCYTWHNLCIALRTKTAPMAVACCNSTRIRPADGCIWVLMPYTHSLVRHPCHGYPYRLLIFI